MQRWSESAKALAWYSKGVASGEAARWGFKNPDSMAAGHCSVWLDPPDPGASVLMA